MTTMFQDGDHVTVAPSGQQRTVSAQPLRVQIYTEIAATIRSGAFGLGTLMPSESDLGERFGVSRTVVREALMLLEEDGLVRSRRGIGRFVADSLPRVGLERLSPLEVLLGHGADAEITVRRIQEGAPPASDFIASGLGIEPGESAELWETVILRDGRPVALSLESIPDGLILPSHGGDETMLAALLSSRDFTPDSSTVTVTAGRVGAGRSEHLELDHDDPVLVVNQTVSSRGFPGYFAKHLLVPEGAALAIVQQVAL